MPMADQAASGPTTTTQHALEGVRRAIVSGRLRPGERIGQDELAQSLGVSIAPVREALAALEQEGQLTYRPRRGYFVAELNLEDLREIYELRTLLEGRTARAAVPVVDDEALERVVMAAREVVDAANVDDVAAELAANRRFHFAILEPAGRPHALRLIRFLWDSTEMYRALYYNSRDARIDAVHAHDRIVAALADRDADRLVAELDDHRARAISRLGEILT